jgi:hypothetical protein
MEGFKVEEVKRGIYIYIYIYKKDRRGGEVAKSSKSLRWKEAGSNKTCTTYPLLNSAGSRAAASPTAVPQSHTKITTNL